VSARQSLGEIQQILVPPGPQVIPQRVPLPRTHHQQQVDPDGRMDVEPAQLE
jgi:hypothetical protein